MLSLNVAIVPVLCRVTVTTDGETVHDASTYITPADHDAATIDEAIAMLTALISSEMLGSEVTIRPL